VTVARENLSIEKRFLRKSLRTPVPDLLKKDGAGEIKFYGKIALERVSLLFIILYVFVRSFSR
jgi:hypothetical protein